MIIKNKLTKDFICGKQDFSTTVKKCDKQCDECKNLLQTLQNINN